MFLHTIEEGRHCQKAGVELRIGLRVGLESGVNKPYEWRRVRRDLQTAEKGNRLLACLMNREQTGETSPGLVARDQKVSGWVVLVNGVGDRRERNMRLGSCGAMEMVEF
ncbi:hypothetical protein MA16_Dca006668 [Dendrobium catenatum]|uniref:Uncharacterized protein n=1 Tax=Dendrobium catenatum TaxID=906689 RepID=A0A2I0X5U3_9ASPA|nr:hypothetical protein MA16_Dca006668 [Dendrobium catenatum]